MIIRIDEKKGEEANDTVVASKAGVAVAQPQQTSTAGSQISVETRRRYPSQNRRPPSNPGFVSVF